MKQSPASAMLKPALDEGSFQQLLGAAFVLQEHNDRLRENGPQPDYTSALSAVVDTRKLIQTRKANFQTAAGLIVEQAQRLTNASGVAIGIVEAGGLAYRAAAGTAGPDAGKYVPLNSCLSAECLAKGKLLQSSDPAASPAARNRAVAGVRALIAAPVHRDGKIAGVLELRYSQSTSFRKNDAGTAQLLAGLIGEAMVSAAELDLKRAVASERKTMLQALERIKPQLERMAVGRSPASARPVESMQLELPVQSSSIAAEAASPAVPVEIANPLDPSSPIAPAASSLSQAAAAPAPVQVATAESFQAEAPALPASLPSPLAARSSPASVASAPPLPAEAASSGNVAACPGCGHQLEEGEAFCGLCGLPRPKGSAGSNGQRKWASLWRMQEAVKNRGDGDSEEQLDLKNAAHDPLAVVPVSLHDLLAPYSPASQSTQDAKTAEVKTEDTKIKGALEKLLAPRATVQDAVEAEAKAVSTQSAEPVSDVETDSLRAAGQPADSRSATEPGGALVPLSSSALTTVSSDVAISKADAAAEALVAELRIVPDDSDWHGIGKYPWTSARKARKWLESVKKEQHPRAVWLAAQWKRHRANIYVGVSALALLIALLMLAFPGGSAPNPANSAAATAQHKKTPPQPELSLFEKALVSLGLADPPDAPAYLGNPNTQVWEDVHTALYYCPGADLSGKTQGGKFTTQHDAQQDQFEPANRKVCE